MTEVEIRLKCIELCYRPDKEAEEVVLKAKVFADWILENEDQPKVEKAPSKKGRQLKAETVSILD